MSTVRGNQTVTRQPNHTHKYKYTIVAKDPKQLESGSLQNGGLQSRSARFGSGKYSLDWDSTVWDAADWEPTVWEATVSGHQIWTWKSIHPP